MATAAPPDANATPARRGGIRRGDVVFRSPGRAAQAADQRAGCASASGCSSGSRCPSASSISSSSRWSTRCARIIWTTSSTSTSPAGYVGLWVNLGMYLGIVLAMPWVLYQVWLFVAPGLYKHERRATAAFIISAMLLFLCGIGVGLFRTAAAGADEGHRLRGRRPDQPLDQTSTNISA